MEGGAVAITFGTFDLFHVGHLRILERAATFGTLIVGVSTDALSCEKKGESPVFDERSRADIVESIGCVSLVFFEESLDRKIEYIRRHRATTLVMGDDWAGKFDFCNRYCDVVYLPRTRDISTTIIKQSLRSRP